MRISAETPDVPRGARLFVRIPLPMTALESQRAFEQPLGEWLTAQGVEFSLRCFALTELPDGFGGVGVEVQTDGFDVFFLSLVVEKIAELGAPPETVTEIESDKATIEFSLAEVAGM